MPSVIGLLEQREARAREELESWLEVLRQVQEEVTAAQERADHQPTSQALRLDITAGRGYIRLKLRQCYRDP